MRVQLKPDATYYTEIETALLERAISQWERGQPPAPAGPIGWRDCRQADTLDRGLVISEVELGAQLDEPTGTLPQRSVVRNDKRPELGMSRYQRGHDLESVWRAQGIRYDGSGNDPITCLMEDHPSKRHN
jgi:hypothetical protein